MSERRNTEFFIARRISGRKAGSSRNVMVRIASITTAISLAVMIIAVSVIGGFKQEISNKLVGFGAHIQIVNLDGNHSLQTVPITADPALEQNISRIPGFIGISTYAQKGGIIRTQQATQGIMLKGVGPGYDWSFYDDTMIEGELPRVGDSVRTKDILISLSLSRQLNIGVDDRVEMVFLQGDRPRRDAFRVSGIYSSGYEELDNVVIPTDIRNVQRLNGWEYDKISGYEVTANSFDRLDSFYDDVYDAVLLTPPVEGEVLMVVDIRDRFPNIFDWLKAHNVNAAVIIVIMLLVALLNMVSALLIILLERTRMVGVLKSLGMTNRSLQKVFLIRSGFIVLSGMVWGNVIGVGLCLIQKYTGLIKLTEMGYFLSQVPISLGWEWILLLNVGVFVVLLALLAIPTAVVARIRPDTTMRYQ